MVASAAAEAARGGAATPPAPGASAAARGVRRERAHVDRARVEQGRVRRAARRAAVLRGVERAVRARQEPRRWTPCCRRRSRRVPARRRAAPPSGGGDPGAVVAGDGRQARAGAGEVAQVVAEAAGARRRGVRDRAEAAAAVEHLDRGAAEVARLVGRPARRADRAAAAGGGRQAPGEVQRPREAGEPEAPAVADDRRRDHRPGADQRRAHRGARRAVGRQGDARPRHRQPRRQRVELREVADRERVGARGHDDLAGRAWRRGRTARGSSSARSSR